MQVLKKYLVLFLLTVVAEDNVTIHLVDGDLRGNLAFSTDTFAPLITAKSVSAAGVIFVSAFCCH